MKILLWFLLLLAPTWGDELFQARIPAYGME